MTVKCYWFYEKLMRVHISHNMSQVYISSGITLSICHLHVAWRQLLGNDTPLLCMLCMFILLSSRE